MEKQLAAPNIDFADSEFKTFELTDDDNLIIYLESWDGEELKIIFSDSIGFLYQSGNIVTNLYEISESILLSTVIKRVYAKEVPFDHPYKIFYLEDLHHFPFIQVVAQTAIVMKNGNIK